MNKKGFSFDIDIPPVAKGRPRFSNAGSYVKTYTPQKTKDHEELVGILTKQSWRKDPIKGPVALTLTFYRPIPKSWSKRRKLAAENGEERPVTKPDLDNYIKSCIDGMNGILFKDDSQIVCIHAHKRYSFEPRISVTIEYHA